MNSIDEILNGSVIIDNSEAYEIERLKKLEKAIEILKDRLVLDIETEIAKENDIELIGYWLVEGDTQKLYTIITKKEYELLKEVLGNE